MLVHAVVHVQTRSDPRNLRRLQPGLSSLLRLHRPVELPVPDPGRDLQCQPAHEALQKVFLLSAFGVPKQSARSGGGLLSTASRILDALCVSRSTEEVIALFISIAFVVDAVKGTIKSKARPRPSFLDGLLG